MDLSTLKRLWDRDSPVILTSLGNDALIKAAGIPRRCKTTDCGDCPGVQSLDWGDWQPIVWAGGEVTPRDGGPVGASVTVVRNHHWGSRWFVDRNRALWSAFIVQTAYGKIFFAGDTGIGDGRWPAEAAKIAVDQFRLAILPIGAFRFAPGQMGTGSHIGPIDAARVFSRLRAAHAIPIHWGTFRLSDEAYDTPPKMLAEVMRCAGADPSRFRAVGIGVPVKVPPLGAAPVAEPDPNCLKRDAVTRWP